MNILPVRMTSPIKFNGYNDDGIIGYDDVISQERRNYIRAHYDSWHMPYRSIYEKEPILSEYQMKLMQIELEKSHDIQQIADTNIYRGQTLVDKPLSIFALKNKGINMVIDLVGYGDLYKEEVERAGLEYYVYNIYENWWSLADFEPKHIDKLVEFLKIMQQGEIYIGCQHGSNDTDIAFILNDFFNPLLEGKAKTKIVPSESDFPIKLNTIYDMLSKSQKKLLGWTPEFEKKVIKKLLSI